MAPCELARNRDFLAAATLLRGLPEFKAFLAGLAAQREHDRDALEQMVTSPQELGMIQGSALRMSAILECVDKSHEMLRKLV